MTNTSLNRRMVLGLSAGAMASAILPGSPAVASTRTISVALKSMSAAAINLYIAQEIGYAQAEGLQIEALTLGSGTNCLAALEKGEVEFAVVASSFMLPLLAKGTFPNVKAFYEYTYPYKWDIAVQPDSDIRSYADLKGKTIGVPNLGTTEYPVTRIAVRNAGLDPDNDVKWLAVGEGVTAGVALDRGSVDALGYSDISFGIIEAAGLSIRYLPRPAEVPMIGGLFIGANADALQSDRETCVAYGRCVAKASRFLLASPKAGALAFARQFPATMPRNVSLNEGVEQTATILQKRIKLYEPPYPDIRMGTIVESEFQQEVDFLELEVADFSGIYTNDLIDEINAFDAGEVEKHAREYT